MRKKIIYGVCMLGLVALVATSCKKNEEKADSFAASFGTLEAVSIDEDDRAYIDPVTSKTFWEAEDKIKIFNFENGRSAIYQTEANGVNVAPFVNNGEYGPIGYAPYYYAFYPADMARELFDGTYQEFTLDATQIVHPLGNATTGYTYGYKSIPQAAKSTIERPNYFQHKIIFGIARFKMRCGQNPYVNPTAVDPTRYVQRIRVTDNYFNLHGTVRMKPNMIDPDELSDMMDLLKNNGVNDPVYRAKWQSYVIDELGYSANGAGKTIEYDYTLLNGGKGVLLSNAYNADLWVCLRPGAFVNGFTIEVDILDCDGVKTLTFPNTDATLTFENDYVPADWSNPDHHRMVMEPSKIKGFNFNPANNNFVDDHINAIYRRDNNIPLP
jgi:hypothetical protein